MPPEHVCADCRRPLSYETDDWALVGPRRQALCDACYQVRFAVTFPAAKKVEPEGGADERN